MENFTGEVGMINRNLERYGLNPFSKPLYRIVWSDFQMEKRNGVFREHVGKVFLREFRGVKEVPKYFWIKERWILERWFPGEFVLTPELPDTISGGYEPIYVFQDKHGNYLPPNLKATEYLIQMAEYNKEHPQKRDLTAEQEEQDRKEIEHYMDALEVSPITNALHMGEAIGYRKSLEKKNDTVN